MNCRLTLLLLVTVVVAAHCFTEQLISARSKRQNDGTNLGIYHGSKTNIQKHPYMVVVLSGSSFLCAATIVSDRWAITSADCVYGLSPSSIQIVSGTNDGTPGKSHTVTNIVAHPSYGTNLFDYDYACIQIKDKFKWDSKTKAINLPKKQPKANMNLVVAGWGSTAPSTPEAGESNVSFLQGKMKLLSQKSCTSTYSSFSLTITDRISCVYNKGKTTLCDGDWGDPFVKAGALYGLFLGGATQGWCTKDAIPNLVASVFPVRDWIKKTTGAKYEDE